MRNRIMEYNAKTNEIREYLPDAGQCTISDDGRTVSYFRNHAKRIILYDTVIFAIYNVIDYCSQTQAVYDHLWNCSYPINELLHSFLDLFTGVKKYVVYY